MSVERASHSRALSKNRAFSADALMARSLEPILELMKSGRFRDALSELRQLNVRPRDALSNQYVALLAQVLQLTGETQNAEHLALQICKTQDVNPSPLARCFLVLGSICRERGDLVRSVWHFEKAFHLADQANHPELACWAKLRLMMVAGEMQGAEAAMAMIPEIRRRVTGLGDPVLLATLHLWVAEFETKRGLLINATHHIQLGRAILARFRNVWLEGSAAVDDFCVSFLKSDARSAFAHASHALTAAAVSGHAATKMAACTNLAHIHLAYGEHTKAEHYLDEARTCCHSGGANEVAVLDGLAQLELARGNLAKCEEYLSQIERAGTQAPSSARYYQSWSLRTKLQLFLAQKRTSEAFDLISSFQPAFESFHPTLQLGLLRQHAELRLMTGDLDTASVLLRKAYADYDGQSPEVFAHFSLTLGKMLLRLEMPLLAAMHLRRSIRIFSELKHVTATNEGISTLLAAIPEEGVHAAYGAPDSEYSVSYAATTKSPAGAPGGYVLDQIKTLIELEGAPQLLGQEVFTLLQQLNCTSRLSLVRNDGIRRDAIASLGDSPYQIGENGELEFRVGCDQGNDLLIVATPRSDLASQLHCTAVHKIVSALIELRRLRREVEERQAIWPLDDPAPSREGVFAAAAMLEILATVRKIAPSNVPVLITGETGTGKEVLARALHEYSKRAGRVFVPFNCAAVPRELVESQLFGHRRGAFSGAHEQFEGVIRAASGGTLFLDEIGDIPSEVQPKLLRFLESSEVQPLGEPKPLKTDVRIISASNADLDQSVEQGRFREDLFYRLNVIRFRIPPLRERREEIPSLVHHFMNKFAEEHLKTGLSVSERTMECFFLYRWPGNVRQLANEMRRMVALADCGTVFEPKHLSAQITGDRTTSPACPETFLGAELSIALNQPITSAVESLERAMLRHALKESGWRVEEAAKALGLSRKGLYLKRRRLGLVESDREVR